VLRWISLHDDAQPLPAPAALKTIPGGTSGPPPVTAAPELGTPVKEPSLSDEMGGDKVPF
jgi:hypothetical protein